MGELKYSRQREAIRTYLAGTKEHPTAEMVYSTIRQTYPNISLGTVYRNLNLLVDHGEVKKLSCGDGQDHFDYDTSRHYHFVCKDCGRILDLEMDSIDSIDKIAGSRFKGCIDGHSAYFYGKCPDCINNK